MSLDINQLVKAVKQAAVEAVQASGPMSVCFGTVTSASPLKIQVDQKKTLTGAQLMLTNNVRDFTVEMTVDHRTENTSGGSGDASFASHNHAYKGRSPTVCILPSRQEKKSFCSAVTVGKNS